MSRTEVQTFFDAYRDAFDRLDGDAVAALWHVPSGIADSAGGQARLTWWSEPDAIRANHRALCDIYRSAGYARAEFEIGDCTSMGDDHAFADVQWRLLHGDGSVLQAFAMGYQLLRTAEGTKILLCTAYQEKLQEMRRHAAE